MSLVRARLTVGFQRLSEIMPTCKTNIFHAKTHQKLIPLWVYINICILHVENTHIPWKKINYPFLIRSRLKKLPSKKYSVHSRPYICVPLILMLQIDFIYRM